MRRFRFSAPSVQATPDSRYTVTASRPMKVISKIHSLDILGPLPNLIIEVVAGWAILLVASFFVPGGATAAGLALPMAQAQAAWPSKTVTMIVPFPAGGTTDILARAIGQKLNEQFKQLVIVDNRPGAGGALGAEIGAKSPPDGYTFMSADNAILAYNEHLFTKLPFNPEKDFTYVGGISRFPLALVVHPAIPVKNLKEFIAYSQNSAGKVNFGSPGAGTSGHLVQTFTQHSGHSYLSHPTYPNLMAALLRWVNDGTQPTPASIARQCPALEARFGKGCAFLPDYRPAALNTRVPDRERP